VKVVSAVLGHNQHLAPVLRPYSAE
jgi:hypothetical protein